MDCTGLHAGVCWCVCVWSCAREPVFYASGYVSMGGYVWMGAYYRPALFLLYVLVYISRILVSYVRWRRLLLTSLCLYVFVCVCVIENQCKIVRIDVVAFVF